MDQLLLIEWRDQGKGVYDYERTDARIVYCTIINKTTYTYLYTSFY